MRNMKRTIMLVSIIVLMAGCGNSSASHANSSNSVDNVLNKQVSEAEKNTLNNEDQGVQNDKQAGNVTAVNDSLDQLIASAKGDANVDYDLTRMGSDMVYATVYQLMVNPDDYVGKTIKMNGLYYATYYEPTDQYYHYCIIEDAAACCAQGLEFVWGDGSHVYPDEYPVENAEIIVTGVFETYQEEGDSNLYCQLKDATMEIDG